jgi:hypothetical protein
MASNRHRSKYSFLPLADHKVVAKGLGIIFCPPPPLVTLLKSVLKRLSMTHLMNKDTCH